MPTILSLYFNLTRNALTFKFWFDGAFYHYVCLPKGLASAPHIFTKLLKPVYATLGNMGPLNCGYMDDYNLQGDTYGECYKNVFDTATLLTYLGNLQYSRRSSCMGRKWRIWQVLLCKEALLFSWVWRIHGNQKPCPFSTDILGISMQRILLFS